MRRALFAYAAGNTVVMLLPARTDTMVPRLHIQQKNVEVRFLKGRLRFGRGEKPAPFPSMIVIFHGEKNKADEIW